MYCGLLPHRFASQTSVVQERHGGRAPCHTPRDKKLILRDPTVVFQFHRWPPIPFFRTFFAGPIFFGRQRSICHLRVRMDRSRSTGGATAYLSHLRGSLPSGGMGDGRALPPAAARDGVQRDAGGPAGRRGPRRPPPSPAPLRPPRPVPHPRTGPGPPLCAVLRAGAPRTFYPPFGNPSSVICSRIVYNEPQLPSPLPGHPHLPPIPQAGKVGREARVDPAPAPLQ